MAKNIEYKYIINPSIVESDHEKQSIFSDIFKKSIMLSLLDKEMLTKNQYEKCLYAIMDGGMFRSDEDCGILQGFDR